MSDCYDVAIVGGGMVGASLALALARAPLAEPLRIALFEAYPLPPTTEAPLPPSFDARATALSYGSRRLLEQLGLWQALAPLAEPIRRIEVSDRGHFGVTRLSADAEQVPALGYVVENRSLGQTLLAQVLSHSAIRLHCPAEVVAASFDADGVALRYTVADDQPRSCRASLLVVADGGRSELCRQLQIDQQLSDYEQCALIANVGLDRPHQGVAYERFTAAGPMALLPLTDATDGPRSALVWSVPLARADEMLAWDDTSFIDALQRQFGYRAGCVTRVGERHSYPLKLVRAREQARRGLVVLGNAAHTLHPIAGQGFNLALRGALALADRVVAQRATGGALYQTEYLQQFVAAERWDQDKTIGFSDRVTRLFSNAQPPLVVARNLGLLALELLPPAKRLFARSAMGLDHPTPRHLEELLP